MSVLTVPSQQPKPYKLWKVSELLALEDDDERWIIPNMIPRVGRTLVYGRGGVFKSTVIFDLCVAMASGGRLCEQFQLESYGGALLVSTEASIYANKDRLFSHIRTRNLHPDILEDSLFYGQQAFKVDTPEGLNVLVDLIRRTQPKLVVLDPYVRFMIGDENSTKDASRFTDCLDWIIDEFAISIIVLHHANKVGDMRGSSVVQGWADSVLCFTKDKEVVLPGLSTPVRVLTIEGEKQRNGQEGRLFSAVPVFNTKIGMVTFGIVMGADVSQIVIAHLRLQIYELLRSTGYPWSKTRLAQEFKMPPDKIELALQWLEKDGLIHNQTPAIVPTRKDGSRMRKVVGWSAVSGISRVDAARAMTHIVNMQEACSDADRSESDYIGAP